MIEEELEKFEYLKTQILQLKSDFESKTNSRLLIDSDWDIIMVQSVDSLNK